MTAFDTTHLLKLLRQHTAIPAVPGYDDEACLRALTATLHGYVVPLLKAEWQEHNLSGEAATYTVPLVENRREYPLPSRATGAAVRKAVLTGPNGARMPLRLLEVDALEEQNTAGGQLPYGYVVRGGRLYLHPRPANVSGWSLRCALIIRPAELCLPAACGVVDGIENISSGGAGTTEIVLTGAPFGESGTLTVDLVRGTPPFEALSLEVSGTLAEDGTHIVVPTDSLPGDGLVVGDFVCQAGQAPFAQVPVEILDLLATRTAVEQLASLGDASVSQAKAASLQERRQDAVKVTTPRTGEARTQGNGFRKWRGFGGSGNWGGL